MDSLIHIIGPSPSELSNQDLLQRLILERDRVRRSILHFREHGALRKPTHRKPGTMAIPKKPKEKTAKKEKKPSKLALTRKLNVAGISIEDLQKLLEEKKKENKP